jgi:hypothetical protein
MTSRRGCGGPWVESVKDGSTERTVGDNVSLHRHKAVVECAELVARCVEHLRTGTRTSHVSVVWA